MSGISEHIVNEMMERAIALSEKASVKTYPNPKVGAVIFDDDGNIFSEGYTQEYGKDHAEADALRKVGFRAPGMNMAVTLEPCNHFGKTPPCAKAIFDAGIRQVFIAKGEENAKAGGGAEFLSQNGVKVRFLKGFAQRVEEIDRFFFKTVRCALPWVTVKVAVTKDGFITDNVGSAAKISCGEADVYVHGLRGSHSAIAVGVGTVNVDDPLLTVRLIDGFDPQPVIFSRNLSIDPEAKIIKRSPIVITGAEDSPNLEKLQVSGAKTEILEKNFTLKEALSALWLKHKINSVLVEGGAKLVSSFLEEGLVDEFQLIVSEKSFERGLKLFDERSAGIFEKSFRLAEERRLGADTLKIYRTII